ncbi:extracellular solute-binding protein [Streptomyces sp. NPDC057137]|uniref:extracellular solute-binding protein n=1 Tax=Streptomyces sp. NPDC057137 TaxID=3346030 RepID=UPI003638FC65
MSDSLSRRTLLRSIAAGGAVVAAPSLLIGCSSSSSSGDAIGNEGAELVPWPAYLPFQGPKPDLAPTAEGVRAGYLTYPSELKRAGTEKPGDGSTIKVMSITYGTPPRSRDENKYWQLVEWELGVKIEFTAVPAADQPNKFATMMASDDIPDIINTGGGNPLPREVQFVRSRCADLSEHLSGDAIKDYPNLANIPTRAWSDAGRIGGKLYCVPVERPLLGHCMFTNQEAFDKAGYRPGMSSADFLALAKTGSLGKKALLGASMENVYGYQVHGVWHGAPNIWGLDGDQVVSAYGTEEFKAAVAYMAELRKAGDYFKDSMATSQVDLKTLFANGTVLSMTDGVMASLPAMQANKGAYTVGTALAYTPQGAKSAYMASRATFGYTVLRKASKERVQLLLRVLDFLASPFGTEEYEKIHYGVEGVHFKRDKDNNPIATESGLIDNKISLPVTNLSDAPTPLYLPGFPEETKALHAYESKVIPLMSRDAHWGLQSETFNRDGANLTKFIKDSIAGVVSGRKSLGDWDKAVEKWRSDGGARCEEEFTKEYVAAKA